MLWMTALMAPTAYRTGGFVAIDTIDSLLPRSLSSVLSLALLAVSLLVLIVAVQIGYKEVTGIGGRFATASLYLPLLIGFDEWFRIPRSWMMLSLFVGIILLISVNIELIIRKILNMLGQDDGLPPIAAVQTGGSE
jgi:TRAP-type C4-dicarboxylate transport system permease small subunit